MDDLTKGIYLGQRKIMIPWGTEIEDLRGIGDPIIDARPKKSIRLCWTNEFALGFFCNVTALQIYEKPNPRSYHINLPTFYWVSLDLDSKGINGFKELLIFLKDRYSRLKKIFGEASFCYPEIGKGMPSVYWESNDLTIGLSPSGWGGKITIAKTPQGYNNLRNEAKNIRNREGNLGAVFPIEWPEIK